ncbi:MAG TPA: two-component regulator propeller domain-containing protein [Bacteroidia bacterium]|nr:two-component regulator propeller domain-containing protein [Bacteroidia bacterium]
MATTTKIAFRLSCNECELWFAHVHRSYNWLLIVLFIFISSCNTPDTPPVTTGIPFATTQPPTRQPKNNLPPEDPDFSKSHDTISAHGPRSITRNVLQDKNGNFWFATWEGIMRYDTTLFTNVTLKENLNHVHVFSLLEDQSGNIWFGTIGGGVYRYNGKYFTLFTTKDGLSDNTVLSILEDRAGTIWFGTGNGVSRLNGNNFTSYTTKDGLSNNFVSTIVQDKNGKLWFGTNGGVSLFEPSATRMTGSKSFTNFKNPEGINFYNVRSMTQDKTGNIWIASQDGLYRYDGKSLSRLSKNFIGTIFEDRRGNLWLSESETDGHHMNLLKYDGKSFAKITERIQVFGIAEDRAGNIWFGTEHGVYLYDVKSQRDKQESFTYF